MKRMYAALAGSAGLFLLLVWQAESARAGALWGLQLCAQLLVPSLLPFFVAAGLMNRLGLTQALGRRLTPLGTRLFRVSGAGFALFLLGLSGGYPLGAASLGDLVRQGRLSPEEARRLLRFCDNTGPSFAVGAVGVGVFSSAAAGLFLWGVHVLAALLTGLLVGRPRGNASPPRLSPPPEPVPAETPSAALTGSVQAAVRSLLGIGGFVVFFSALSSVLDHLGVLQACAAGLGVVTGWGDHWCRTLLTGFLELSSSIGLMQGLSLSPPALVLAAFLLGWGGLCVHFQAAAVLSGSGLKMKERLGGKLLHGVLSALLAMALGPIFF